MALQENTPQANDPSSGQSDAQYKSLVEKLEREKHGMYEEMKAEREKRQSLESRLQKMEQNWDGSRKQGPAQDENLQWITNFAQQPREQLRKEFDEYVRPIQDRNVRLEVALAQREALEWLAEREGTSIAKAKELMKELQRIGKEKNLLNMPIVDGTQATYELFQLEKAKKDQEEKNRAANIQNSSTEAPGTPATPNVKPRFKESDIAKMDLETYQHYQKDINLAKAEGRIDLDLSK